MIHLTCPNCSHSFCLFSEDRTDSQCPSCGNKVLAYTPPLLEKVPVTPTPIPERPANLPTEHFLPAFTPSPTNEALPLIEEPEQPKARQTKFCIDCSELIDSEELVCQYCGEKQPLLPVKKPQTRFDAEPNRGAFILMMGLLSFIVPPILGPFAWKMGEEDMEKIINGTMDAKGEEMTNLGRALGMIATFFSGIVLVAGLVIMLAILTFYF